MKITAQVTLTVERHDGTTTSVTEQVSAHTGDNPRYEPVEVARIGARALDVANTRFAGKEAE